MQQQSVMGHRHRRLPCSPYVDAAEYTTTGVDQCLVEYLTFICVYSMNMYMYIVESLKGNAQVSDRWIANCRRTHVGLYCIFKLVSMNM
jgi:hypothetical protein